MLPEYLLLGFVLVATFVALKNWRLGILLAILAGMVQDPIRKVTLGAPPFLVLASVPIWLAVYLSVLMRETGAQSAFRRAYPRLASAAMLFVASLLVPAALAFQYGLGGWQLAVLGLFGYISPLLGVLVGFAFARQISDVRRLVIFYATVAVVMLIGTPLQYADVYPGWGAIGTEALGANWVRSTGDGVVKLHSGFFRSPDIMGWHAAAATMLGLSLAVQNRARSDRLWLFVAAWGVPCLLLAGRRKMQMMPVVWAICLLVALLGAGRLKRAMALSLIGLAVAVGAYYASSEFDVRESYYVYAGTVTTEGPIRVLEAAVESVMVTYSQAGFLGLGLGSASQGTRYLSVSGASSWQESGSSKIMAELGAPGFICALLLVWRVVRALQANMSAGLGPQGGLALSAPIIGFVVANVACFIVSHQVYSDAVILTMTSLFLGVALGAPRWALSVRPGVAGERRVVRRFPAAIEQAG